MVSLSQEVHIVVLLHKIHHEGIINLSPCLTPFTVKYNFSFRVFEILYNLQAKRPFNLELNCINNPGMKHFIEEIAASLTTVSPKYRQDARSIAGLTG